MTISRGNGLAYVTVALGWDPVRTRRFGARQADIDLNLAALVYAGDRLVEVVYHERLASADHSVRHQGDSMTGEGKGDNEIVLVDLTRIDPAVSAIYFLVTCYDGRPLSMVDNAFCRAVDQVAGAELFRYDLARVSESGWVMARLQRSARGWEFEHIDTGIAARHPIDAVPLLGEI